MAYANRATAEGQLPPAKGCLPRVAESKPSVAAPAITLIDVKLTASIVPGWRSAIRQSSEFDAKPISAAVASSGRAAALLTAADYRIEASRSDLAATAPVAASHLIRIRKRVM